MKDKEIQPIYDSEKSFLSYDSFHDKNTVMTPVYFEFDNKRHFVVNIVTKHPLEYEVFESHEKMREYFSQLNANKGKYFAFHSIRKNVKELLQWMKDNNYQFREDTRFWVHDDFIELMGNMREYSAAFHYRIYDMQLANDLMTNLLCKYPYIQVKDFRKTS